MLENTKEIIEEKLEEQLKKEESRFILCEQRIEEFCKKFSKKRALDIFDQMNRAHIDILRKMSKEHQEMLCQKLKELSDALSKPIKIEANRWHTIKTYNKLSQRKLFSLKADVEQHCNWFTSYIDKDLQEFEDLIEARSF